MTAIIKNKSGTLTDSIIGKGYGPNLDSIEKKYIPRGKSGTMGNDSYICGTAKNLNQYDKNADIDTNYKH